MMQLSQRQEQVLRAIQTNPVASLQSIADELGVTRERVRQIAVKLRDAGVIDDRMTLKERVIEQRKEEVKREEEQKRRVVVYRKKIWRRMMFVGQKTRLRRMAHIDHRGLVYNYPMPGEETTCQFEGCNMPVRARGFCSVHYGNLRRTGSLWVNRRSKHICEKVGCDTPVYARNMCHSHYKNFMKKNKSHSLLVASNTSGYRGVSKGKSGNYIAYIRVGKKHEHLGTFDTKELAARAYDTAARKCFGEQARLNFPNENIEVIGNKRKVVRTNSGHRSVYWHESRKRWIVLITREDKRVYVGRFINLEDAIYARNQAEGET